MEHEQNMNTLLDDISAVIGFSATVRLVAWFSDRPKANVYVPGEAEEGQLLVKVIGLPAARLLSKEWPREHLAIPKMNGYTVALRRRTISRMLEQKVHPREIATSLEMSERRVLQIRDELVSEGLLASLEELLGPEVVVGAPEGPGGVPAAVVAPAPSLPDLVPAGVSKIRRPRRAAKAG